MIMWSCSSMKTFLIVKKFRHHRHLPPSTATKISISYQHLHRHLASQHTNIVFPIQEYAWSYAVALSSLIVVSMLILILAVSPLTFRWEPNVWPRLLSRWPDGRAGWCVRGLRFKLWRPVRGIHCAHLLAQLLICVNSPPWLSS